MLYVERLVDERVGVPLPSNSTLHMIQEPPKSSIPSWYPSQFLQLKNAQVEVGLKVCMIVFTVVLSYVLFR